MFKKYESYERKGIRDKKDNNMKIKGLAKLVFIELSFIKVFFQFFEYLFIKNESVARGKKKECE